MTAKKLPRRGAPPGMADLEWAAARIGYAPNSLRMLQWRGQSEPPPFHKRRNRLFVIPAEFEAWAGRECLQLLPVDAEEASA